MITPGPVTFKKYVLNTFLRINLSKDHDQKRVGSKATDKVVGFFKSFVPHMLQKPFFASNFKCN